MEFLNPNNQPWDPNKFVLVEIYSGFQIQGTLKDASESDYGWGGSVSDTAYVNLYSVYVIGLDSNAFTGHSGKKRLTRAETWLAKVLRPCGTLAAWHVFSRPEPTKFNISVTFDSEESARRALAMSPLRCRFEDDPAFELRLDILPRTYRKTSSLALISRSSWPKFIADGLHGAHALADARSLNDVLSDVTDITLPLCRPLEGLTRFERVGIPGFFRLKHKYEPRMSPEPPRLDSAERKRMWGASPAGNGPSRQSSFRPPYQPEAPPSRYESGYSAYASYSPKAPADYLMAWESEPRHGRSDSARSAGGPHRWTRDKPKPAYHAYSYGKGKGKGQFKKGKNKGKGYATPYKKAESQAAKVKKAETEGKGSANGSANGASKTTGGVTPTANRTGGGLGSSGPSGPRTSVAGGHSVPPLSVSVTAPGNSTPAHTPGHQVTPRTASSRWGMSMSPVHSLNGAKGATGSGQHQPGDLGEEDYIPLSFDEEYDEYYGPPRPPQVSPTKSAGAYDYSDEIDKIRAELDVLLDEAATKGPSEDEKDTPEVEVDVPMRYGPGAPGGRG